MAGPAPALETMRQGTILYLNGTSSAGKSSLARAVQAASDDPYLHVGADTLFGAMSRRYHQTGQLHEIEERASESVRGTRWILDAEGRILDITFGDVSERMLRGLHAMTAALAREGNNIIVDAVWFAPWLARHAAETLAEFDTYLIGVRCAAEVAQAREEARGDRLMGLSALLAPRVHEVGRYDVEIDTGTVTPEQGAQRILAHLDSGEPPVAARAIRDG